MTLRPLPLVAVLCAGLALGCSAIQEGVQEGLVNATFCEELPKEITGASPFVAPQDTLSCLHPAGTFRSATTASAVTSCTDAENWEIAQTVTLTWQGPFGKQNETKVKTDYRVVGGYVSVRSTKLDDSAAFDGKTDCVDGQWRQSDEKVIDVQGLTHTE